MDQELQSLLTMLYGDRQMSEREIAAYTKQWNSNHKGFRDILKNAALNKIKRDKDSQNYKPTTIDSSTIKAIQVKPTLVSIQRDAENVKPIEPKRAANDMSAISDFKQAFRTARQGGHKTFFWKKTKANPSGMFSTEMSNTPSEDFNDELNVEIKTIPIDKSKINVNSWEKDLFTPLPNMVSGKTLYEKFQSSLSKGPDYQAEITPPVLNSLPIGKNSMRPYLQQGGTISPDEYAKNLITRVQNNDPEALQEIEQIMQAAQQGDPKAVSIAQSIQKIIEAMKQQSGVKAKLGAKLNHINKLKGICPEGTEKIYLAKGGCMCKQKAKEGAELKTKKMNEVQKFKAQKGNKIEPNDTIHHNKQVYDLTGKHKQFKKLTNKDYRNLPTRKQTDVDNKDMMRAKDAEKKSCGGVTKKKK